MAVQITIRNVPDSVRDALASRAHQEQKSMQEYLLGELERLAERSGPAQWLERVQRRKAAAKIRVRPVDILRHRDADRRRASSSTRRSWSLPRWTRALKASGRSNS